MSIEKTALNGSIETLYEWLKANALGAYFDEITLDSSDGKNKVICRTDGIDFLTFNDDPTKSGGGITVKNKTGESAQIESSAAMVYGCGFKLDSGLLISFRLSGSGFTAPRFAITKDDLGSTAVIAEKSLMSGSGSTYSMFVCSPNSQPLGNFSLLKTVGGMAMTSMCPFVLYGQEASYTPDVFYVPFAQYTGEAVFDMNGTKYLSTGIFAVKV